MSIPALRSHQAGGALAAAPGAANSLGANKALVIDTTAPTISGVSSTKADGTYGAGTLIPITVTFGEPVNVVGVPQLTLETGTTDRVVNYTSGTVALNGGTILDLATNAATLTLPAPGAAGSLGANKNIVVQSADYDFGDAPNTYATLLASNGARHTIVAGAPFLGTAPDAEADGQPTVNAVGDDNTGADDEDGVTFTTALTPDSPTASVALNLTTSPVGGKVSAWIDFNRDGDWADTGERILNDVAVTAGSVQTLNFPVPGAVKPGASYARIRISTAGTLSYNGAAADGEVEDYAVQIPAPVIDVGEWTLLPDTAGQVIPINVSGGHAAAGVVMYVQVANGYDGVPGSLPSGDGPNITNVDVVGVGRSGCG